MSTRPPKSVRRGDPTLPLVVRDETLSNESDPPDARADGRGATESRRPA